MGSGVGGRGPEGAGVGYSETIGLSECLHASGMPIDSTACQAACTRS